MNNIIDFIFLVNVKGKVGASWVQLALAKVAYKKQVFSLFRKHVDLSQLTLPLSQSVNCTAIMVVILRSKGKGRAPADHGRKLFLQAYLNTYNAVFPQVI